MMQCAAESCRQASKPPDIGIVNAPQPATHILEAAIQRGINGCFRWQLPQGHIEARHPHSGQQGVIGHLLGKDVGVCHRAVE